MKYFDGCRFLKVSRWHNLWRSNIPNLSSLKQQAGVSGFVFIDAEPWGTSLTDIAEIGIAFIPLVDMEALQSPPSSLDSLQTRYPIQLSKIRVAGREQGRRRKREPFISGPTRLVEPDDVYETLKRLFQSFRDALGPQGSLTLIGFDLVCEFRIMSSTYLGITEHVSSWVDLQEIIKDVSSRTGRSPSMRESLAAFGFEGDDQAILPNWVAHSAGTDALHNIALLVNLLALSPDATLEVERRPVRKGVGAVREAHLQMKAKNQFSGQPTPKGILSLQSKGDTPRGFDELEQFVEQTNGSSAGNGQFWEAISEFDSQLTDARTASELAESLEAASTAIIEHERVLRKQKKENEKIGSEETCSGFVNGVDDLELGDFWG